MNYADFILRKSQGGAKEWFAPLWIPEFMTGDFSFQSALCDWAVRQGRAQLRQRAAHLGP